MIGCVYYTILYYTVGVIYTISVPRPSHIPSIGPWNRRLVQCESRGSEDNARAIRDSAARQAR